MTTTTTTTFKTAGQEAYECRQRTGQSWADVADCVGTGGEGSLEERAKCSAVSARKWAMANGRPWPVPAPTRIEQREADVATYLAKRASGLL